MPSLLALILALLLMGGLVAATGDVDLDLSDEGFVWYGVVRTAAGDVPLRDFQSYEPGRYVWGALAAKGLGDGILALRRSTALFGALGLWCGLLAARRVARSPFELALCGAVLAAWMVPRHKHFEPALAMAGVWVAVRLVERPSAARHLAGGIFAGLAACFGRNHGLYAALGLSLLIAWRRLRQGAGGGSDLGLFVAGGVLGFAPMLAALAFVPGFGASFLDSLAFFALRGTNVPHPVPWPWRGGVPSDWASQLAAWSVAAGFALLVPVYGAGLLCAWRTRRAPGPARALLIAATAIGVFYVHHASVRSDASHLAQAIHPLWLALFALPRAHRRLEPARAPVLTGAAVLTLFALPAVHPALGRHLPDVVAPPFASYAVGGDELQLPADKARALAGLEAALRGRMGPGERLFAAPIQPGVYPLLGLQAPVWDLYFLWPADAARQRRIVEGLEDAGVSWALIQTGAPFGREELRFDRSHPAVWAYLMERYRPVPDARLPAGQLLLSRDPGGAR